MSDPVRLPEVARRAVERAPRVMTLVEVVTPLGRGVLVVGVIAAVLAQRFHWQEFTQLSLVAFGLLLVAAVWQLLPGAPSGELVLRQRRTVAGGPPPVADLSLRTATVPMLFPRVVVPAGRHSNRLHLPFLRPFTEHTEMVELPALPRGAHLVGPLIYEKSDPVGLMSRQVEVGTSQELLVTPHVTELAVLAGGLSNALDGATSQRRSMNDLAFHALREYVRGDDLRHVHWRSSAKAGELLVRQFHETRRGQVTILLDAARTSYPQAADFELAVSAAASIALRCIRDDFDACLRCGIHYERTREAIVMTDLASRFEMEDVDNYVAHARETAETVAGTGTGLIFQVTGAARSLLDLDEAAVQFGRGAEWVVVRADGASEATVRETGIRRELFVPDLRRLQDLMVRGRR